MCAIFEKKNLAKGGPQDLDETCFPYTYCLSFMPPIGFWDYSSKNLNLSLANCLPFEPKNILKNCTLYAQICCPQCLLSMLL